MDDDASGWALPTFDPNAALERLKRDLREPGLTAKPAGADGVTRFERRGGSVVARASVDGATLALARVKRPTRGSAEWVTKTAKHSGDVRDFVADLKKQMAQWSDADD